MSTTAASVVAYRIRVAGHLDDRWAARLGGRALARHADGTTTVTTDAGDQARLHGTLAAVRDLGATLLAVEAVPTAGAAPRPTLARTLSTERLVLRPASPADAAATWRYRRLREVNEWLDGPHPDLATYAAAFGDPDRLAATVVVELRDGAGSPVVVGDLMLRLADAWAQAEVAERARGRHAVLGWALDPAHTGHGYATEAVRAVVQHCFAELGVHRVTAECFLDNVASWRLMERVGLRREAHTRRDALHRSGRWLDSVGYAALADEWPCGPEAPTGARTHHRKERP